MNNFKPSFVQSIFRRNDPQPPNQPYFSHDHATMSVYRRLDHRGPRALRMDMCRPPHHRIERLPRAAARGNG